MKGSGEILTKGGRQGGGYSSHRMRIILVLFATFYEDDKLAFSLCKPVKSMNYLYIVVLVSPGIDLGYIRLPQSKK
jgi:hypothetical protein